MIVFKTICEIGLLLSAALTALQFTRKEAWWVRMADFPHIQITIATGLFLLGAAFTAGWQTWSEWFILSVGLMTLVYQAIIIFPYTPLSAKQAKSWTGEAGVPGLSILVSNVYMYNDCYSKLLDEVKKYRPDIFIALETDAKWSKGLSQLDGDYPYTIKKPADNTYGLLIFSRLEIADYQIRFLVEEDVPSVTSLIKLQSGEIIRLYVVHPEPPSPSENKRSTERDAELILVGEEAAKSTYPVIVAGDLNDVAWSHTTRLFQRLSGLLDPRIGRGFFNTFNAKNKLMRWPLDHVFISEHFQIKGIERGQYVGSDHFPMLIELALVPQIGKKNNDSTEKLTQEDRSESENKLEKALNEE